MKFSGLPPLILAALFTSCGPDPDAMATAHAEVKRIERQAKAESDARMLEIKIKWAYLHGDGVGDLYVRCTGDEPPKKPANQRRCQALLDRIEKEMAAAAAADAKAKANW